MPALKINHLAAIASIVALHALGFLWYSPVLFGTQWMEMVGWTQENMQANPPSAGIWIVNLLAAAAPVYFLAWLFTKLNVTSGVRGAGLALLAGVCISLIPVVNGGMFADNPTGLAFITAGFTVAGMTISGFILGAWVKKG